MIRFEVLESPDSNVLTTFEFFQNEIYLGNGAGNLSVRDPSLRKIHLMIEVAEGDLLVHPQREVDYYLLNGKRATEIRKLKTGDTLTIGKTTLKVLGFEETKRKTKKQILDVKMAKLIQDNSQRLDAVQMLVTLSKNNVPEK